MAAAGSEGIYPFQEKSRTWFFSTTEWEIAMLKKLLIASLTATAFASVPMVASAQQRAIVITEAPPPMRAERMPREMRRGMEWAPGHWAWRNGRYQWVEGRWINERRGMHWVPEQWVQRNGRWEMIAGHWERGERRGQVMGNRGMGDRDRDGVPNRYDRDRDNDGVRNRNDRDRDGDGVPNRYDARPNNPNRN
jgi:hypothetical protein